MEKRESVKLKENAESTKPEWMGHHQSSTLACSTCNRQVRAKIGLNSSIHIHNLIIKQSNYQEI